MSSIIRVKTKPRIQVDFQEMWSPVWRMQLGWNRQLGADEKDVGRLPDVTWARMLEEAGPGTRWFRRRCQNVWQNYCNGMLEVE